MLLEESLQVNYLNTVVKKINRIFAFREINVNKLFKNYGKCLKNAFKENFFNKLWKTVVNKLRENLLLEELGWINLKKLW